MLKSSYIQFNAFNSSFNWILNDILIRYIICIAFSANIIHFIHIILENERMCCLFGKLDYVKGEKHVHLKRLFYGDLV